MFSFHSVPSGNVLPQRRRFGAHGLPWWIELAGQLDRSHAVHLQRWLHWPERRAVHWYDLRAQSCKKRLLVNTRRSIT